MILQGFKHKDVVESKLDTESPTVSRIGKYLMVELACIKQWKLGTMDVKSAFLQSDYITHEVEIYGEPSADMRRLLSEMIGLKEHEVMRMTKPAFGDVRAPRQWNETASKALVHDVKLWKHDLDGCLYMSTRLAAQGDPPFEIFEYEGNKLVVDGVFCLHVDNIMAAGEGVFKKEDAIEPHGEPTCFAERLHVLLHRFKFGSVDYGEKQMFCGCNVKQSLDNATVTFDLQKYLHQLKPLNIEKARKQCPEDKATPKGQSQLRGLLGGLAWPANQTQPHLAASVSLAQASSSGATVGDLLDANKTLRYAKETADVPLTIRGHGPLDQLRFGVYTDASWATRPDGSYQGGWIIFVGTEEEFHGSKPFPLTVLDWSSKKLTRICRSSLAAEAQTMCAAIDSLEWAKTLFAMMAWPSAKAHDEEIMRWLGYSPVVTDARALYDASNSKAPGMKLQEKRTAIEIKMACERMAAAGGVLKWCNSHQQLADGVTKASARQKLAWELKRKVHCLRYDPEGTASKKVKQEDRQEEQDNLDKAAKEFEMKRKFKEGIYTMDEMEDEERMECKICLLKGCELQAEDGKLYCSKRHYHADQQKKKNEQNANTASTTSGVIWMMTLANEIVPANAMIMDFVVVIGLDKIFGFAFLLFILLAIVYHLGKRHGRREVQDRYAQEQYTVQDRPAQTAEYEMMESSEDENAGGQQQENTGVRTPPRARPDVRRFTPAEIAYLDGGGYHIFSDEAAFGIRQRFMDDLRPSIED